jgi:hypothetical protein
VCCTWKLYRFLSKDGSNIHGNGRRINKIKMKDIKSDGYVTRVEVIERGKGRQYSNYDVKDAWISFQDAGRTIKIFINESL